MILYKDIRRRIPVKKKIIALILVLLMIPAAVALAAQVAVVVA